MEINGQSDTRSDAGRENTGGRFLRILRLVAIIAVMAASVGSFGLMFWVGHRNPQWLLMVLFTIWDLAPFAALLMATAISKRWSVITRTTLYCVMLVVAFGSLTVYGYVVVWPPASPAAAPFLVVPSVSWLLILIVVPIAALISGRLSRSNTGS